jgi:hypothetical protein
LQTNRFDPGPIIMRPYRTSLILCIFLSACASGRAPTSAPLDTSYTLRINQAFEALENGTHVDFQHGVRVPQGNLDRWTTYCRLYVYNRIQGADYLTDVNAGQVEISAVTMNHRSSDDVGHPFHHLSWGLRDYPAYYLYRVGMRLTSPDQPDLRTLNCYRKWATANARQYPTLPEIRQALGNLITVVPAAE